MDVKKVSLYTYQVLFAAVLLWISALGTNIDTSPSTRFLPLLLVTIGCMIIIAVGLTKIRKAVGLDIRKKEIDQKV